MPDEASGRSSSQSVPVPSASSSPRAVTMVGFCSSSVTPVSGNINVAPCPRTPGRAAIGSLQLQAELVGRAPPTRVARGISRTRRLPPLTIPLLRCVKAEREASCHSLWQSLLRSMFRLHRSHVNIEGRVLEAMCKVVCARMETIAFSVMFASSSGPFN